LNIICYSGTDKNLRALHFRGKYSPHKRKIEDEKDGKTGMFNVYDRGMMNDELSVITSILLKLMYEYLHNIPILFAILQTFNIGLTASSFAFKPIISRHFVTFCGKANRSSYFCIHTFPKSTSSSSFAKLRNYKHHSTLQMSSAEENKSADTNVESGILWEFATHTTDKYHDFSPDEADAIRSQLLKWYRANRRKLPWRGDPGPYDGSTAGIASSTTKKASKKKNAAAGQKDIKSFFGKKTKADDTSNSTNDNQESAETGTTLIPVTGYSVWVSEIMLQQTRVEAVIKYYLKWMGSFPTVQDLANATEEEVNAHWAGLGFYRRARMLHQGAKFVVDELDGVVPGTVDELLKVSGIGPYTASAISSIAFDQCVPVVDGNVCRVISRLKGVANNIKSPIFKDKIGWRLAEQIVTAGNGLYAGEVNQAMMELGATYCAPSGTGVDSNDPLIKFYSSTKIGKAAHELVKTDSLAISDFVSRATLARGKSSCSLCEDGGISSVLFQIGEDLALSQNEPGRTKDFASIIGHSRFPTAPPKKAKREEILSVVVMSHSASGVEKWFMVKRPSDGLLGMYHSRRDHFLSARKTTNNSPHPCSVLPCFVYVAGQWEFPSACAWSSADEPKTKAKSKKATDVPSLKKSILKEASDNLLRNCRSVIGDQEVNMEQVWNDCDEQKTEVNEKAIEHIFSHVRWSMHSQYKDISASPSMDSLVYDWSLFSDESERDCRWMSEDEMQQVGITSSVKKVLAAVKACSSYKSPTRKRKKI
jgi:A/G-specific adenine glycosylase